MALSEPDSKTTTRMEERKRAGTNSLTRFFPGLLLTIQLLLNINHDNIRPVIILVKRVTRQHYLLCSNSFNHRFNINIVDTYSIFMNSIHHFDFNILSRYTIRWALSTTLPTVFTNHREPNQLTVFINDGSKSTYIVL